MDATSEKVLLFILQARNLTEMRFSKNRRI